MFKEVPLFCGHIVYSTGVSNSKFRGLIPLFPVGKACD